MTPITDTPEILSALEANGFGTVSATKTSWLVVAGELKVSQCLKVHPRGELDWQTALAALDAQYGKGKFYTSTHGNALAVQRVAP